VVLVLREAVTVLLARAALRRGLDLEISWVGRLGTFGVFTGLFWSLAVESWVTEAIFVLGVALGIYATALYAIAGRRALEARARA
jgi:cardiolipin synthase